MPSHAASFLTGYHAIAEYLRQGNAAVELLLSRDNSRTAELAIEAKQRGVPVRRIENTELDGLVGENRGAALRIETAGTRPHRDFEAHVRSLSGDSAFVLLLDGITDPHNVGAILRSADLFFADAVVVPERRSAGADSVVAKISAGASAYVPFFTVTNLTRTVEFLKKSGFWVYGADMAGTSILSVDVSGKTALVMGSEGQGLF
jgi:23S rRNA (guanosine2251-2'-O)-methyltransferase